MSDIPSQRIRSGDGPMPLQRGGDMKRHARFGFVLSAVLLGVGLAGCTPDQATRNIVEVYSINNNLPLLSDVYNNGKNLTDTMDDYIPSDIVEVTFFCRPHDNQSPAEPGGPFGTVTMKSYDVIYGAQGGTGADLDGDGTNDISNFTANINAVVPTGGTAAAAVLVVSGAAKSVPPISCLGPYGGCMTTTNEFAVNVTVIFHGVEETSGADITCQTGMLVRISDYADAK
jgi:hypothetical protein